ncbi:MAG: hypothetical protein KDA71_23200, partial [Planctomycetales bacterium]|nr:hypothetical protein [Planctomycetales bacterium]
EVAAVSGAYAIEGAIEQLHVEEAALDNTLFEAESETLKEKPGSSKQKALAELNASAKRMATATKQTTQVAGAPDKLGSAAKEVADAPPLPFRRRFVSLRRSARSVRPKTW